MSRLLAGSGLLLWAGLTLVLSERRWFARPSLAERLRPYTPGGLGEPGRSGLLSVASFREAIAPFSRDLGARISRLLDASEDLEARLVRVHSPLDVTAFRVRQVGWTAAALGIALLLGIALRPGLGGVLLLAVGAPALTFLVLEQQVVVAARRWQHRVFLEVPVVAEQLAMLLSAGYSLTGALNRVAERGSGACARDLARVCRRIRQGLSEAEALAEWAATVRIDALDRLVPVLSLNREASDLGRLISEEARALRRDVHRGLIEAVERRGQQVWVPVTVATLVPGVIFMAIPFLEALRMFGE